MRSYCALLILPAVLVQVGFAVEQESDSTKVYPLPEILVTATRGERDAGEVGRSVTVISREQLAEAAHMSLAELLAQQEGIYVVGAGQNPGMIQSLFLRGANNNHTAVMIDDVRITDPASPNTALDLSELSLADLEQVEIVRGAHSTLYGSSAIGGVVNLITRKNGKPGFGGRGTFFGGTSTFGQQFSLQYGSPIGVFAGAEFGNERTQGLNSTVDTVTTPGVFKRLDTDGSVHTEITGKAGYSDERWGAYVAFKRTDQKSDIDRGAYQDDDNSTIDFGRNLLTYNASFRPMETVRLRFLGGYSTLNRVAVDDSSVVNAAGENDHTFSRNAWSGTTLTNELQVNLTLDGVEAVVGGGAYAERMSINSYFYTRSPFGEFELRDNLDSLDLHAVTRSVFAHLDLNGKLLGREWSALSIGLGGRLLGHSSFGIRGTYEINPSVRVGGHALVYASLASGFNTPSLYQLYSPERNYLSGIARGNPGLAPETSRSIELGVKTTISQGTSVGVAYFLTRVRNAIEYVYLWDGSVPIDSLGTDWSRDDFRGDTYLNLGTQETRGVEINVMSRLSDQVHLAANLSIVSGSLAYSAVDVSSDRTAGNHVQLYNSGAFLSKDVEVLGLVRRPHTANISLTYLPVSEFALTLQLRYAGARNDVFYDSGLGPFGALGTVPVSDYTLVDLTGRLMVGEHVTILARGENIFNTKYSEIKGFTTRGRGGYISTRFTI